MPSAAEDIVGLGGVSKIVIDTTEKTISSTASKTTLYTTSVAGGILSTNNAIRVSVYLDVTLLSGGGDTIQLELDYGTTFTASLTLTVSGGTGTAPNLKGMLQAYILGDGATNAQVGSLTFTGSDDGVEKNSANVGPSIGGGGAVDASSEDSTASKTLTLSTTHATASASTITNSRFWVVESIV